MNHIKPHGSLYGMAARRRRSAHAVADAADVFKVPLFGMINTLHETVYQARGHAFVAEYYADLALPRRRRPDHHPRARAGGPGKTRPGARCAR